MTKKNINVASATVFVILSVLSTSETRAFMSGMSGMNGMAGGGWICSQWSQDSMNGGGWTCTQWTQDSISGMNGMSGYRMQGMAGQGGALMQVDVRHLQTLLNALGYTAGPPDGLYGPQTESAIKAFQRGHSMTADGRVSPQLFQKLDEAMTKKSAK